MYPLLQVGPFSLSTGGLFLLVAALSASWLANRTAYQRSGAELVSQVEATVLPAALGALIGGRLWYGMFNWDLYGANPALFVALRIADLSWPGGLLGGMAAAWLWARMRSYDLSSLADMAALSLPPAHMIASVGLLLSGEALGVVTDLPWGIALFGAVRHPTQLYYALAALASWGVLLWWARYEQVRGVLPALYLGMQGLTLLLIEPLRADSLLLPEGVRAAQVLGLALLLVALVVLRHVHVDRLFPLLIGTPPQQRPPPEGFTLRFSTDSTERGRTGHDYTEVRASASADAGSAGRDDE